MGEIGRRRAKRRPQARRKERAIERHGGKTQRSESGLSERERDRTTSENLERIEECEDLEVRTGFRYYG